METGEGGSPVFSFKYTSDIISLNTYFPHILLLPQGLRWIQEATKVRG